MFCSLDSYSLKKNHESIASARSIRGFFTRRRATLGKPAIQNAGLDRKLAKCLRCQHGLALVT
jgi:hypothetical protein